MTEPCIMDIKMGKRTWDPLASEEKMMEEKVSKFLSVKNDSIVGKKPRFNFRKNTKHANKTLDSGKSHRFDC